VEGTLTLHPILDAFAKEQQPEAVAGILDGCRSIPWRTKPENI
jgi:hypothetical protein